MLNGFTIRGGNADDDFNPPNDTGGGMFNTNSSSPTLVNLIFSGNSANWGGGLALSINGNPTLTDVSITDNSVTSYGGGLYLSSASATLTNVTISNNTATGGGGIYMSQSSPSLTNVTLSGNDAGVSGAGGGIYLNNTSNPVLTNVTFSDNSASNAPMLGGGIFVGNSSSPTLKNVLIANSPSGGDCVLNLTNLNGASSNNLIEDNSNACGMTHDPNNPPYNPRQLPGQPELYNLPSTGAAMKQSLFSLGVRRYIDRKNYHGTLPELIDQASFRLSIRLGGVRSRQLLACLQIIAYHRG